MRHDFKQIAKMPPWVLLALCGLLAVSIALLTGSMDLSGTTVPGWVGVLALAAFAGLLVLL